MSESPVPVRVPCRCPGAVHPDGCSVVLKPKIGLRGATIGIEKVREAFPDLAEVKGALVEVFCLYGVLSWDLEDEKGLLPVNPDTIRARILDDEEVGRIVADQGDELYSKSVTAPLVAAALKFSESLQTVASTSAPKDSAPKRRKRSKPSSTSTSPMDATETTTSSPAGDSS